MKPNFGNMSTLSRILPHIPRSSNLRDATPTLRLAPSWSQLRLLSSAASTAKTTSSPNNDPRPERHTARPIHKSSRKSLKAHPSVVAREQGRTAYLRRRSSPSRPRIHQAPPKTYVLPDLGLSSEQLAALSDHSPNVILKCARELDEGIHDVASIIPPAIVELIAEELALNVRFTPHLLPLTDAPIDNLPKERRMPVITVMGHVDHGKTSLLDALRKTDVAASEHGGITQSVAAFRVALSERDAAFATFIDTPGHAAFSAMRANGTVATDIVVLVVAADDGIMPQTIEAANLARAANVPVIVAVNKCDLPGTDTEQVRFQLLRQLELNTEQLGGDVQCVDISAKTGMGLKALLEAISLQAEELNLQSPLDTHGAGVCLESRVDRSLGSVATIVVRGGSFRKGSHVVFQNARSMSGDLYGKVRLMLLSDGRQTDVAGPGDAVGVVGIREAIAPGSQVRVVESEKEARTQSQKLIARNQKAIETIQLANAMMKEAAEKAALTGKDQNEESVEDSQSEKKVDQRRSVVVVVKGDVKGSADAVAQCVQRLGSSELRVKIVDVGIGEIVENDLRLAGSVGSLKGNKDINVIVGFNVKVKDTIRRSAKRQRIQILSHKIIYHLEDELKELMGQWDNKDEKVEKIVGEAGVVRVFENGTIAGCSVEDGSIEVGSTVKVMRMPDSDAESREMQEVFTGEVSSIKHFSKSIPRVDKGMECGLSVKDWSTFQRGDRIVRVTTANSS